MWQFYYFPKENVIYGMQDGELMLNLHQTRDMTDEQVVEVCRDYCGSHNISKFGVARMLYQRGV